MLSFLRWCASCSNKTICFLKKSALILQIDLYQHRTKTAKKMSEQNWAWKYFKNRMKQKRSGENVSLITDLKSCCISMTQNRFQESWENTINQVFKKYTNVT